MSYFILLAELNGNEFEGITKFNAHNCIALHPLPTTHFTLPQSSEFIQKSSTLILPMKENLKKILPNGIFPDNKNKSFLMERKIQKIGKF